MKIALRIGVAVLAVGASVVPAVAQSSASYKLEEHALNAGGHPALGSTPASASFRVSLEAVGDAALGNALSSGSFRMEGGFVGVYPPPGEVRDLHFKNKTTLGWRGERAAVRFNLYRDSLSTLPGDYGACLQSDIAADSATDTSEPALGTAWFYLVTGENRLYEEGTKGYDGAGAERPNPTPCP